MKKKFHKATPPKPKPKTTKKKVTPKPATTIPDPKPDVPVDDLSNLGRQPVQFYVERFGANRFRVIDNIGFVFSNGQWVAVDVDGFNYMERVIGPGDPNFVAV